MKWNYYLLWLSGLMILALTGCGALSFGKYAPEVPIASQPLPPAPPPQEGALWTGRQPNGLLSDNRPVNVGDLVTISITETAKASEIANTKTGKDSGKWASRRCWASASL